MTQNIEDGRETHMFVVYASELGVEIDQISLPELPSAPLMSYALPEVSNVRKIQGDVAMASEYAHNL